MLPDLQKQHEGVACKNAAHAAGGGPHGDGMPMRRLVLSPRYTSCGSTGKQGWSAGTELNRRPHRHVIRGFMLAIHYVGSNNCLL